MDSTQLLVGAVIGFASAGGLRWWQYRRDLWLGRVKDLVDAIVAYATASAEYWASTYDDDDKGKSAKTLDEATIIGLQTCIDGLLASVILRMDEADAELVMTRFNKLSIYAAGSSFGSISKSADPEAAKHVLIAGYALKVDILTCADRALTVGGLSKFIHQRANRMQTSAIAGRPPAE